MDDIDKIAFVLWMEGWGYDFTSEDVDRLYLKWQTEWMAERDAEHFGDCTQAPCPCMRCHIDRFYKDATLIYERVFKENHEQA